MPWEAWLTLLAVAMMFLGLARSWAAPEVILWTTLIVLVVAGAVFASDRLPSASSAVSGLGNSGLVTIGFLFVVVEGLERTGATRFLGRPMVRLASTPSALRMALMTATATASSMLNNTAVVAMFLPITKEIASRSGISPSKLFLPMCYAATLGGLCTLIGTSTNLIVDGLLKQSGHSGLGMFEIAWVGLPLAVTGIGYLMIAGNYLPDRRPPVTMEDDPREYTVEMSVVGDGPLVGKTIFEAGLRGLQGLYLAEIERGNEVIVAPAPTYRIEGGDQLVFVGIPDSVVDLRRIAGLRPAVQPHYRFDRSHGRVLTEVVVAPQCPLVGLTIRDGDVRGVYDAVVIAVTRQGKRVGGKIGDVVLQSGDGLLLETQADFVKKHRLSRHFYLVSTIEDSAAVASRGAALAGVIMVSMVAMVALGYTDLLTAAMAAAVAMLAFRCCTPVEARTAIQWNVLLQIGAALGLAQALQSSGAASSVAESMISLSGQHPHAVLVMVYLATMLGTELVTNNAAAAIMFPIAVGAAESAGVSVVPMAIAVLIAASSSFATPFGYQTNLMVAGPGGYRFWDYVRLGLPLDVMLMILACFLIPLVWSF